MRHFRFDDEGITDDVVKGRRSSSYFMPIPKAKKKGGQLVFDEWTGDRIEENRLINQIRDRWLSGGSWAGPASRPQPGRCLRELLRNEMRIELGLDPVLNQAPDDRNWPWLGDQPSFAEHRMRMGPYLWPHIHGEGGERDHPDD